MKFSICKSRILPALQGCVKVIDGKNLLPILDNLKIIVDNKVLTITASNLEITISQSIILEDCDMGQYVALIDAKKVLSIVKELPNVDIQFTLSEKNIIISIPSGNYTLSVLSADEFPILETVDYLNTFYVDVIPFRDSIAKTIFACANDELRPVLNGVSFKYKDESLEFASTDAQKLSSHKLPITGTFNDFIISKKSATLIRDINNYANTQIICNVSDKHFHLNYGNILISCRLIDGNYPNYHTIIPTNHLVSTTVNKNVLMSAVKSVSVCSNKNTNLLKLEIGNEMIKISSEDIDYSVSAIEVIPCQSSGEITIGLRSTYMLEVLSNIDSNEIVLNFTEPNKACVITPVEEDGLYLLMPMILS